MKLKALLIEDSPKVVNRVLNTFESKWPSATLISTDEGAKGIEVAEAEHPDIIILNVSLPDMSGFEVLERIRLFSNVPIIILTVTGNEADELRGLDMGADDYIVIPFNPINLLARTMAILRRTGLGPLGK
ncbi:response regulator transcription factor [Chloroflexota bacterium]